MAGGLDGRCKQRRTDVTAIAIHPAYDDNDASNDLALVRLADPLGEPFEVRPWSRVGGMGEPVAVVAVGYGTDPEAGLENEKRMAELTATLGPGRELTVVDERAYLCRGDSGAPLLAELDGMWRVVGIASGGDVECEDGRATALVDDDVDWIETTITRQSPTADPP